MAKDIYGLYVPDEVYISHHGIKGQKWGVKHGPPYPLSRIKSSGGRRVRKTSLRTGGLISKSSDNQKKGGFAKTAKRAALGAVAVAPTAAYLHKVYSKASPSAKVAFKKGLTKSAAVGLGSAAALKIAGGMIKKRRQQKLQQKQENEIVKTGRTSKKRPMSKEEALRRGTPEDVYRHMSNITPEEYRDVLTRFRNESDLARYVEASNSKRQKFYNISRDIVTTATTAAAMVKLMDYIKLVANRKVR